jgi:hypothetical protein
MLSRIEGINCVAAGSSREAEVVMSSRRVDCIVTDILRRNTDGEVSSDDGYAFFRDVVRPGRPTLPVIFHTKNLPTGFAVDAYSQYLSKWESEDKKAIELEPRISEAVKLYDAFAHEAVWARIEPRLVRVRGDLLSRLQKWADLWRLNPQQFEQVVAELLDKMGQDRGNGQFPLIRQIDLAGANLLRAQALRRSLEVTCELSDLLQVRRLGVR